jgi:hypothetical protein
MIIPIGIVIIIGEGVGTPFLPTFYIVRKKKPRCVENANLDHLDHLGWLKLES